MFKFCVAPGVSSNVASNLLVAELKTKTIPFCRPPDIDDITLLAFLEPTLTFISDILINL